MYQDAVDYLRTEANHIDTIETEILKIPDRNIKIRFDTSEFIGTDDLLSELRKKIPQKQEIVNTRKIAESAGITDCDIDIDLDVSYTPITEKIKLVTAKRGVYEARLKIDKDYGAQALSLYILRPLSEIISFLRHGLTERGFFGHAGDGELLNYLEECKSKNNGAYFSLFNRIIDTTKEKLTLASAPESYSPAEK